jgi:hypothetical protein
LEDSYYKRELEVNIDLTGAGHQWLMPVSLITWEVEIGRIIVLGQLGQKSSQDCISVEKSWVWWCVCHPSYSWKCKIGRPWVWLAWAKNENLLQKMTRDKRARGMAEAIEHLPSKCETLVSTPHTEKKIR